MYITSTKLRINVLNQLVTTGYTQRHSLCNNTRVKLTIFKHGGTIDVVAFKCMYNKQGACTVTTIIY